MINKGFVFFLMLVIICGNSSVIAQRHRQPDTTFRVIGFYQGSFADLNKYDVSKLTHIIFCFTHLSGNRISLDNDEQERILKGLVALKKNHPNLRVLISFGGWGGCETCSEVFSTDKNRHAFATSARTMLLKYKADGLDLDWESPVIGGYKNHKATGDDKANFTLLLKELRKTLPPASELCFDANSFDEYIRLSVDWGSAMPLVDFVNVMTYGLPADAHGQTGHHSALYSSSYQNESVNKAVEALHALGVPMDKIIIGAAFYAFVAEHVDSINHGLGRPGKFKCNVNFNRLQETYTERNGYEYHWDSVAQAPFLYNKQLGIFVTCDDKKSVSLKTRYAIDKKLGGIMFWKLNGDTYREGLLDAIYRQTTSGKP